MTNGFSRAGEQDNNGDFDSIEDELAAYKRENGRLMKRVAELYKENATLRKQTKPLKPRSTICWLCGRRLYQWRVHVERVVDGHSRILHRACSEALKKNPEAKGPYDDVD